MAGVQVDSGLSQTGAGVQNFMDNFEIKVIDAKKNRSLISKKMFKKGQVIFTEKPLVSSQFAWNEFYNYKACEFCMRPLENALENIRRLTENNSISLPYLKECCTTNKQTHCKCLDCGVDYCSQDCRQQAFSTYHQALCLGANRSNPNHPYNLLMDFWKQIHLPPETTTINLIVKLIAIMKQTPHKESFMQRLLDFEFGVVNEQEQIPHKLLNEKYFNQLEALRELTLEYFKNHLYVKECEPWLTPEGFRQLFSLFGRNSQGIGSSPFSVYVENTAKLNLKKLEKKKLNKYIDKFYDALDKTAGAFLNSEGSGLYELQSKINHSCKPSAEIAFQHNNFQLTLVALEDIYPGQEIFISYLDECELSRSRHSRQKLLRENYLFSCECDRCKSESNQPDVTSDEDLEEDDSDEYEDIEDDDDEEDAGDENNNLNNKNEESMEN